MKQSDSKIEIIVIYSEYSNYDCDNYSWDNYGMVLQTTTI